MLRRPLIGPACLALAITCAVAALFVAPARGAIAELYGGRALGGPLLLRRVVPAIEPSLITRDSAAPRESFSARWTAGWRTPQDGEYTIETAADDHTRIRIDGIEVIPPGPDGEIQHSNATIHLSSGLHFLDVEYEQLDGGMFLNTEISRDGGTTQPLRVSSMLAIDSPAGAGKWQLTGRLLWLAAGLALLAAVASVILTKETAPSAGIYVGMSLAIVLLFAGALRLDALLGRTGPIDRPPWVRVIDREARLPLSRLAPAEFQWVHPPRMFQQGDPAAYLFFAREMKSFYAAHAREPLFIGLTRALLPMVGYQDFAVGLASALSSLLLVAAVFVLGSMVASRLVGLLAALALAIERDVIAWSVEGWRDDTFALAFVVFACVALSLRRRITFSTSIAFGVITAGALLTRVTSLSFIAAGALALAVTQARTLRAVQPRRQLLKSVAAAAFITLVLAGPYFVNCYRTYGNALYPINVHTSFYRSREGVPSREPLSAAAYIRGRFAEHPLRLAGTFVSGMTTYPFSNKWGGFEDWVPHLGTVVAVLSFAGLVLLASYGDGRFLLWITAASMLPYAFTHDIQGGAEWRFTLHVYPVLLVAAALALERAGVALWTLRRSPRAAAGSLGVRPRAIVAGGVLAILAVAVPRLWPYVALTEDLWFNRPYSIFADADHTWLFSGGWSEPATLGNVTSRSSEGTAATVWMPIARRRAHLLRVRADPTPIVADARQELWIYVNRQLVSTQPMQVTEGRVGAYDVIVPASAVHKGLNRLDLLVTRRDQPAAAAGIRLWYLRVTAM